MPVPAIDIIIPVYNAYEDLQLCVDSVLRTVAAPHRIILINDCSPDPRISSYFRDLSSLEDPRITLLDNNHNLGFVQTTNRGMALSDNDVVLLNSDTIVTTGWVGKVLRCAQSDPRIGTITPFSNNAEICSFPLFCQENSLPDGCNAEAVNLAMEASAVPIYPDIPTAVGFCMYIRRELLKDVGLFDAETFSLGYGEENDLCMRAAASGWRNVLCDDTFIQHTGNKSFDQKKQALAEQNLVRLLEKHPDYQAKVMQYIGADPVKPIRLLAESRLAVAQADDSNQGILHIMHGASGGGTEQHILDLMQHSEGRHYLLIAVEDVWYLKDYHAQEPLTFRFDQHPESSWARLLAEICVTFGIGLCHVHHLVHCREGVLEAIESLGLPYGFTIHDFFLACPTINLLDDTGTYCGAQTDLSTCQACLGKQPEFDHVNITDWRWLHQQFINNASFVIAPSRWAADTFASYFPHPDYHVIPHGVAVDYEDINSTDLLKFAGNKQINVCLLGAIGPVKGARQLEKLVERTRERELPIRWIVIGYTDNQFEPYQAEDGVFSVHGSYEPRHLKSLIDYYNIDLTLFPSAGPETYCYTLTEAWLAGRPVLVPAIGALEERVRDTGAGWIMRDWRECDLILDDILSICSASAQDQFNEVLLKVKAVQVQPLQAMVDANGLIYAKHLAHRRKLVVEKLPNRYLFDTLLLGLDFSQFQLENLISVPEILAEEVPAVGAERIRLKSAWAHTRKYLEKITARFRS